MLPMQPFTLAGIPQPQQWFITGSLGMSGSVLSLYQITTQLGFRAASYQVAVETSPVGGQEGKKIPVPKPGCHVFPNQAQLASKSTAGFYGCRLGLFMPLCLPSSHNCGWKGFCFCFCFCFLFLLEFLCVLNLNCSKKTSFSWTSTKGVFWIGCIFTKNKSLNPTWS